MPYSSYVMTTRITAELPVDCRVEVGLINRETKSLNSILLTKLAYSHEDMFLSGFVQVVILLFVSSRRMGAGGGVEIRNSGRLDESIPMTL